MEATKEKNNSTIKMHKFRLGANAGMLLMYGAKEDLLDNLNPYKAIKRITDSLHGCPLDMATEILIGKKVVTTLVKEQMFDVIDRDENLHSEYPKINIRNWYKYNHTQIGVEGRFVYFQLEKAIRDIKHNKEFFGDSIDVAVTYDSIFKFISGDTESMLRELADNKEIEELDFLVKTTQAYLTRVRKMWEVMTFMEASYPDVFTCNVEPSDFIMTGQHIVVGEATRLFNSLLKQHLQEFEKRDESLKSYIDNAMKIDKLHDKKIKPNPITDLNDAGWLAPNGDWYGLNGDIGNKLHNNLAVMLYNAKIIPNNEENEPNPDVWLEQNGWMKVHGCLVLFASYNYFKRGVIKEMIDPSKEQLKQLSKYGKKRYGTLQLGFQRHEIPASRITEIDNVMFRTKFFVI